MDAKELHQELKAWIIAERHAGRMTEALEVAGRRMLCALWAAAHNPTPPPTMAEDVAAFEKARHT